MSASSPRTARALIRVLLPSEEHAELLGDLEERFQGARARRGHLLADLWYWKQALGSVPYLLIARTIPVPRRNRMSTHQGMSVTGLGGAFRIIRRERMLSMTTALVLAMGIGATTTMYSIVKGLRQELPLEDAHEIVAVAQNHPPSGRVGIGFLPGMVELLSDRQRAMDDIAAYRPMSLQFDGWPGAPRRVAGAAISPHAFGLLGVQPVVGRLLEGC